MTKDFLTTDFARLGVPTTLVAALADRGITTPTPIQAATLPDSLAGRDVLGRGRTGSGKTFAFVLPVVARLTEGRRAAAGRPRALILAPTRELATQITESLVPMARTAGLATQTIFGGVNQNPQVRALKAGVDVLVATPGRLLDLIEQGHVSLADVSVTVLDEADHMSDMGFLPSVKRILNLTPRNSQRLLFSATLDNAVDVVVRTYLRNPVVHQADSAQSPVTTMDHHVLTVTADNRTDVIADLASAPGRTIVFTRTKHGAKKLAKHLVSRGIPAVELHGNLAQNARTRNLDAFGSGRVETLVATDIAARGIHVDEVALVVHADPPTEHKAYLHRSGRTARAGHDGTVVTIATPDQRKDVAALMRAAKITPTITAPSRDVLHALAPGQRRVLSTSEAADRTPSAPAQPQPRSRGGRGGSRRGAPDAIAAQNSRSSSRPMTKPAKHSVTKPSGAQPSTNPDRRGGAAAFSAAARPSSRRRVRSR